MICVIGNKITQVEKKQLHVFSNLETGDGPHGVTNGYVALGAKSHDNPAGGGAVQLSDHEVYLANHLTKAPRVALPVVAI